MKQNKQDINIHFRFITDDYSWVGSRKRYIIFYYCQKKDLKSNVQKIIIITTPVHIESYIVQKEDRSMELSQIVSSIQLYFFEEETHGNKKHSEDL